MLSGTTVSIDIPSEILHAARLTPQELKQELSIALYQQGRISFGKARELAGMTPWQFQQLLASREIEVHYAVEEYEADLKTLRELGRI